MGCYDWSGLGFEPRVPVEPEAENHVPRGTARAPHMCVGSSAKSQGGGLQVGAGHTADQPSDLTRRLYCGEPGARTLTVTMWSVSLLAFSVIPAHTDIPKEMSSCTYTEAAHLV